MLNKLKISSEKFKNCGKKVEKFDSKNGQKFKNYSIFPVNFSRNLQGAQNFFQKLQFTKNI